MEGRDGWEEVESVEKNKKGLDSLGRVSKLTKAVINSITSEALTRDPQPASRRREIIKQPT